MSYTSEMMIEVMNQEKEVTCSACKCTTDLEESEGEVYHFNGCYMLEEHYDDPSEQYARDMYANK